MSHPRRDFAADARLLAIAAAAAVVGVLSTLAAYALLQLIRLFTNLFFFHLWAIAANSPARNTLGCWVIPVPIVGALIIPFGPLTRLIAAGKPSLYALDEGRLLRLQYYLS